MHYIILYPLSGSRKEILALVLIDHYKKLCVDTRLDITTKKYVFLTKGQSYEIKQTEYFNVTAAMRFKCTSLSV
jgi:hypothetical protein